MGLRFSLTIEERGNRVTRWTCLVDEFTRITGEPCLISAWAASSNASVSVPVANLCLIVWNVLIYATKRGKRQWWVNNKLFIFATLVCNKPQLISEERIFRDGCYDYWVSRYDYWVNAWLKVRTCNVIIGWHDYSCQALTTTKDLCIHTSVYTLCNLNSRYCNWDERTRLRDTKTTECIFWE